MHLLPWDYLSARPAPDRGLASVATLIAAARAEAPNSLLFDNGDFLQGSALGDHVAERGHAGQAHPVIAAMNHLGYDAGTLGNHEFSHGLPFLAAALDGAAFPLVASNLHERDPQNLFSDPLPRVTDHLILTRQVTDEAGQPHPLRIGVLGFLPPQTTIWERQSLENRFEVEDILTAAARAVPALRAAGADLVIVLSHSGIGTDPATPGMENATRALAGLQGIDVIVAGHSHLLFPSARHPVASGIDAASGTVAGMPVILPGAFGTHLGVADLVIERQKDGAWHVLSKRASLRAVQEGPDAPPAPADPALSAIIAPAHAATLDWLDRPVGRIERAAGTAFALVAPCHLLRVVTTATARHVADALAGTEHAHLPVLAAAAPFRAGGRGGPDHYTLIRPGNLTLRQAIDIYPHPNGIAALRITGDELAAWLERAAGLYFRLRAGRADQPLINPDFAPFNFDLIDGLDFRIDLSQPARFDTAGQLANPDARRITGLTWRGRAIRPEDRFILATNSYRAAGGGAFPGSGPDRVVYENATPVRDILIRHIAERGTGLPPPVGQWGFVPLPGTSATLSTAPQAGDFHADAAGLHLQSLGIGPCGFHRFRLSL